MIKVLHTDGTFEDAPKLTRKTLSEIIPSWMHHPLPSGGQLFVFYSDDPSLPENRHSANLTILPFARGDLYLVYIAEEGHLVQDWDPSEIILDALGGSLLSLEEPVAPRRMLPGDVISMGKDFQFTIREFEDEDDAMEED